MLFNLFAVSALFLSTTVYAAQEAQCVTQHIASGYDSCASISHQYGINVHDFQNWNYDLGNDPRYCRPPIPGRAYCVRIGRIVDNRGRGRGGPPNHPKRETKVVKRADKKKEKEKEKAKENDKKTKEKAKEKNKEAKAEKKKEEKAHNKELKAEEKKSDKEAKAEEKKEEKAIDKKDKAEEKKEEKQRDKEAKEKVLEENKEHDAKIEANDKKHEKESKDKGKESKENKKGGSKDTHKNKVKKSSNEMEEFTSTDSYQKSSDDGVADDSSKGHKDTEGLDLAPHTNPNCKKYYVVQDQDSCDSVSKKNHISNQELYDYNTGLHRHGSHECDNLDTGKAYCVAI
ncbi:hypothetical protein CLU79DRAFT_722539 [Phycomyces nitens]|nr:hypothetical protein CLU79DRAFT_722539 [Phycomyces nitens]